MKALVFSILVLAGSIFAIDKYSVLVERIVKLETALENQTKMNTYLLTRIVSCKSQADKITESLMNYENGEN